MQSVLAATQILQGIYPPGLPLISPIPQVQSLIPQSLDSPEVFAIPELFEGVESLEAEQPLEESEVSDSVSTDQKVCSICNKVLGSKTFPGLYNTSVCKSHYTKIRQYKEVLSENEFICLSEDRPLNLADAAKSLYQKIEQIYEAEANEEISKEKSSKRKTIPEDDISETTLAKRAKSRENGKKRAARVLAKNIMCATCNQQIKQRPHPSLYGVTICDADYNRLRRIGRLSPDLATRIRQACNEYSSTPEESAQKFFKSIYQEYKTIKSSGRTQKETDC